MHGQTFSESLSFSEFSEVQGSEKLSGGFATALRARGESPTHRNTRPGMVPPCYITVSLGPGANAEDDGGSVHTDPALIVLASVPQTGRAQCSSSPQILSFTCGGGSVLRLGRCRQLLAHIQQ